MGLIALQANQPHMTPKPIYRGKAFWLNSDEDLRFKKGGPVFAGVLYVHETYEAFQMLKMRIQTTWDQQEMWYPHQLMK